ncbi:hypothetical protein BDV95DRAFT_594687 [Massariosphaeria phaeospora]|uniref:Peptidase S8/S53 domain-containing protein n=1 Tax=Massariosphaeria phaeospora TaxID=100035 RepID=A0A7C8MBX4_9PLEO|nr:hypothetical protein BDV95DRAFT_594687 [Massariosphaeria phaeospora]
MSVPYEWQYQLGGRETREYTNRLIELGIPIVVAAGNQARNPARQQVDAWPEAWGSINFPLIVVGGATQEGVRWDASQVGEHTVNTHAAAERVPCLQKDGQTKPDDGTSYSAPAVAGVIANYMAYNTPPWQGGLQGRARVEEIRRFIKEDPQGGWKRPDKNGRPGVRIVWNGATANNQKEAGPDPEIPPPNLTPVKCNGLGNNDDYKYVTRNTISALIDNTYCPLWAGATEASAVGTGMYLAGTPETVEISVFGDEDDAKIPTVEDCKKYLHEILDGCDQDNNPMNWKGGGELEVDEITYRIQPQGARPPAPGKPTAWCALKGDGVLRMWGTGMLNSGFGIELRTKLGSVQGLDTADWEEKWEYELLDGHEWAVEIPIDVNGLSKPVAEVAEGFLKDVANFEGFDVKCEGGEAVETFNPAEQPPCSGFFCI